MEQLKVMFVCLGNICRSPLAHAIFQRDVDVAGLSDVIHVESSGTGSWHIGHLPDARMRKEAASHGVEMDHRARQFEASDLSEYDLIFAMDRDNKANILYLDRNGENAHKVALFRDYDPQAELGAEVPDPYYGGARGFAQVYEIVERTSAQLLDHIRKTYIEGAK
ncbi:MAG: low molecular weight phosphotyrosine protein phosphatase [Spirochaetales bacterium]|nr:low molecular weight phosphotyrosine protein phosphatase [Spirochaetales bacterium]